MGSTQAAIASVEGGSLEGMRKDRTAPAEFAEADWELAEALENLDDAANYASWIFDLMRPHLGERILEIGAGHGTFTDRFAGIATSVVAEDLSPRCCEVLHRRFEGTAAVRVVEGSIDDAAGHGPFDAAVMINVLEHIADDGEALRKVLAALEPGGRLALWVPALPLLYSRFDRRVGHHRRYRRRDLVDQVRACGYTVIEARYVNLVGALGWLVSARLMRRAPTGTLAVRTFDRLVPALRRLEARVHPPVGQSLLLIASRPPVAERAPQASISEVTGR